MTLLSAHAIGHARGGRTILSGVDLACTGGQFVALLGANGAGKSTLLSILAGLVRPSAGAVRIDGVAIGAIDRRQLARRRAWLPQNARPEWPLSVERLVALGRIPRLPAFGDLAADDWRQVEAALVACDLIDRRAQAVTTLSGGELARAMLARALVGEPDILLADEPLAGLDPRHAIDGIERLAELASDGRLVIAALHDLTLAARHATHVAVLRQGRLIASGPTAATLTAALVSEAFDVAACVSGAGAATIVDFVGAADHRS